MTMNIHPSEIRALEDHEIDLIVGGDIREANNVADVMCLTLLAVPFAGVGLAIANGYGTLAYYASKS